jgi:hypothetical protein
MKYSNIIKKLLISILYSVSRSRDFLNKKHSEYIFEREEETSFQGYYAELRDSSLSPMFHDMETTKII